MAVHEYHPALLGFNTDQIWHDGCAECESRSQGLPHSLSSLDDHTFRKAWKRATAWNRDEEVGQISYAERPLLNLLWSMQIMFERFCNLPIGDLPGSTTGEAIALAGAAMQETGK